MAMRIIVAYDYTPRRVLQLIPPFILSVVFETMVDLVILEILLHRLGTSNMIAYTMTEKTTGETEM